MKSKTNKMLFGITFVYGNWIFYLITDVIQQGMGEPGNGRKRIRFHRRQTLPQFHVKAAITDGQ